MYVRVESASSKYSCHRCPSSQRGIPRASRPTSPISTAVSSRPSPSKSAFARWTYCHFGSPAIACGTFGSIRFTAESNLTRVIPVCASIRDVSASGRDPLSHPAITNAARTSVVDSGPRFITVGLRRLIAPDEDEYRSYRDRGDSRNWRNESSFFCRDLDRTDLYLVTAFRVSDSAHRGHDRARDYKQQTSPAQWLHDYPV